MANERKLTPVEYLAQYCPGASSAQVVTVSAQVNYLPILRVVGFTGIGVHLNASSQAAVTGI